MLSELQDFLAGETSKLSTPIFLMQSIEFTNQWFDCRNTSLTTEAGKTLIIQLENEVSQIYDSLKYHYKCCKDDIGESLSIIYN